MQEDLPWFHEICTCEETGGDTTPKKFPALNFRSSNIEGSAGRNRIVGMNRVAGTSHPLDPMGSGRARKAGTMVGYHFPIQVAAGNRKLLSAAEDLLAATQVKIVVE